MWILGENFCFSEIVNKCDIKLENSTVIYSTENVDKHKGKRYEDVAPHIFTVSDNSYRQMLKNKQNLCQLLLNQVKVKLKILKKLFNF